eukprot:6200095-Pleurochrysis_carterae.AAC.3
MAMPASAEGAISSHPPTIERGGSFRLAERGRSGRGRTAGTVCIPPGCLGSHRVHPPSRPGGPIARQPQRSLKRKRAEPREGAGGRRRGPPATAPFTHSL